MSQQSRSDALHVERLGKRFGTLPVLSDVSFTTKPGEILGLIGPNGAGKTTLLECLTGLLPLDTGSISWQGRPLSRDRRTRIIWYQPDDILPYARQRTRTTLSFFRQVHGAEQDVLDDLIGRLELAPVLARPLEELSKGYRRRLNLAIALLSRRPLLLLDEPFDGFDLHQSLAVMDLLRRYRKRRTMILSIHQLSEAEKICDRFLLLGEGRVLATGSLSRLCDRTGLPIGTSLEEVFLAIT